MRTTLCRQSFLRRLLNVFAPAATPIPVDVDDASGVHRASRIAAILASLCGIVRLLLVSFLAVALLAVSAAFAAGRPAPVSKPKIGAAPWPAPKDPMRLTRLAGLVPKVNEHLAYHVHLHLDVFVNGKRVTIPAGIGIDTLDKAVKHGPLPDGSIGYGSIVRCPRVCISPLHTHADFGFLHTETDRPVPNRLGQFFVEWGVRLDRSCVGGYCKPDSIRVYVNGKRHLGDPRRILLANQTEIAIAIGSLPRKIPAAFPAGAII